MSDNVQSQKAPAQKPKGLGRGLGSLLGSSESGAFSKTAPGAANALAALSEKLQKAHPPSMNEGFVEKNEAPVATVEAAPSVEAKVASNKPPANQVQVEAKPTVQAPEAKPVVAPAPAIPNHLRLWQIGIERIKPNPNQPRQIFEREPLEELAASIREKGIIQPLLLRKKSEDQFEIIAGERRWRAAQIAGLNEVPALIKDSEDQDTLELALIENIQRENLNPIEEAEAYEYLIEKYNLTQGDLAKKVGKDRATVANLLRVLQLHPNVRERVSNKELSLGQAKVLLSLDGNLQQKLAAKAIKETLSVRALEKLVAKAKEPATAVIDEDEELRRMLAKDLGEELQKLLGSKVQLDYSDGKGKIGIHFYSDMELNQLADRLRESCQQK